MPIAKPVAGTALPASNPLYSSIHAFWPFNDASGTTLRELKGGLDATINLPATITWGVNDKGEPAIVSAATTSTTRGASFSPVTFSMPIPYYAFEIRFKPGTSDTYGLIMGTQNGSNGSFVMHSGKVSIYPAAGQTTAPSVGSWHHVVFNLPLVGAPLTGTRYFLDGNADGVVATPFSAMTMDTMFTDTLSETFVATVDYIRIWNRFLTEDEIISLRDDPMQVFAGTVDSQPMMFVTT